MSSYFYPRPPRGGRRGRWPVLRHHRSISIHALREEGDHGRRDNLCSGQISIHALREEGDAGECPVGVVGAISIHALREEGDSSMNFPQCGQGTFLSTPSARRATARDLERNSDMIFLSTPSARRATQRGTLRTLVGQYFYPRPPRGGRQQKQRQNLYFQTNYTTFCTNLEEL